MEAKVGNKVYSFKEEPGKVTQYIGTIKKIYGNGTYIDVKVYGHRESLGEKFIEEDVMAAFKKMASGHYFNAFYGEAIVVG